MEDLSKWRNFPHELEDSWDVNLSKLIYRFKSVFVKTHNDFIFNVCLCGS